MLNIKNKIKYSEHNKKIIYKYKSLKKIKKFYVNKSDIFIVDINKTAE